MLKIEIIKQPQTTVALGAIVLAYYKMNINEEFFFEFEKFDPDSGNWLYHEFLHLANGRRQHDRENVYYLNFTADEVGRFRIKLPDNTFSNEFEVIG